MDKKRLFLAGWSLFLFGVGLSPVYPEENQASPQLMAQRMRIPRDYVITIQGEFDEGKATTWLQPSQLRAGRGDNVTFINESTIEVRIRFGRGASCREVSVKALGWNLEPEKCYETRDTLKSKEAATLRFRDVGLYHYEIEFVDKDRREQGTIHIQSEDR
ncbi:MAG: hypothetical protein EHM36_03600 [Deltaproteobacteria bacterium]|nr:MAG: hypothetical protein EHM36_03600 [Deltaproteobacteria bacterium]